MDPKWAPTIVTGLLAMLGWAAIWGSFRRTVSEHSEHLEKLELDKGKQWDKIGSIDREVGEIQGALKIPSNRRHQVT